MVRGRVVFDFVHVIPRRGEKDIGIADNFALGKDGEKLVGGLEGRGGKVEAMEVTEVGLVARRSGEGPVAEKCP